jgi:hypothetical protein
VESGICEADSTRTMQDEAADNLRRALAAHQRDDDRRRRPRAKPTSSRAIGLRIRPAAHEAQAGRPLGAGWRIAGPVQAKHTRWRHANKASQSSKNPAPIRPDMPSALNLLT